MARKATRRWQDDAGGRSSSAATGGIPREIGRPVFAQPAPTEDPTVSDVKHAPDGDAHKEIDQLNKEHKIPAPRGGVEPQLTRGQVLSGNPVATQAIQGIIASGQIVF